MLFQSVHSYEHLAQQLSEKKCHHRYSSKQEITHQHHNIDHCFVCTFKMSSFVASTFNCFKFQNTTITSGYTFFESKEIAQFFKGSLFALRAPPVFIA
jgi:hypothetical protein